MDVMRNESKRGPVSCSMVSTRAGRNFVDVWVTKERRYVTASVSFKIEETAKPLGDASNVTQTLLKRYWNVVGTLLKRYASGRKYLTLVRYECRKWLISRVRLRSLVRDFLGKVRVATIIKYTEYT